MPFQKVKPQKCPRCGKVRDEWYVRPSDGKIGDTFCATCSREKAKARREAKRAAEPSEAKVVTEIKAPAKKTRARKPEPAPTYDKAPHLKAALSAKPVAKKTRAKAAS